MLNNLPKDEFELYYGSDVELNVLLNRFRSSQKTTEYVSELKRKISGYLQKKLAEN
jgi:hypothetical protein